MNIINTSKIPIKDLELIDDIMVNADCSVDIQSTYQSGLSVAQINLNNDKYLINVPVDSVLCVASRNPIANETVTTAINNISSINVLSNLFSNSDFEIVNGKISLYNPTVINSFSINPSICEIGSQINSISCTWTVSKMPASISHITLDGQDISIQDAYNPESNTFRYVLDFASPVSNKKTINLTIVDAKNKSVQANKTLDFRYRLYYGSVPLLDFNNITNLSELQNISELSTSLESKIKTPVNVYVDTNEYFYYISPFSPDLQFTVNGFTGGVILDTKGDYINSNYSQHTYSYKIYRSERPSLKQKTFIVSDA